ncbi:MAG: 2-phospho-L-lactate transferase [Actinomycetota bacterium]|nr:2-phospho-L-lactate transferase [Actinomycetota bacterium]
MICVLAGGFGAARFLRGLVRVVPPEEVVVVGNTGDDIDIYGVHVSPDLDIVTFMLGGVLDEEKQFGLRGDTTHLMDELRAHGVDTWFTLGDRDYGVCLARTLAMRDGSTLSGWTKRTAERFGVAATILPMTDDPVHTVIGTDEGEMHFQEYWVRRRASIPARSVRLDGAERARAAPGVLDAIRDAEAVIVAPSNPVVSIGTILAVPGIRAALHETRAPVVGISPIIGGKVVRGMADKLMPAVGAQVSARGTASLYEGFLDGFVVDLEDDGVELPCAREVAQTIMHGPEEAAALAKTTLAFAERLR